MYPLRLARFLPLVSCSDVHDRRLGLRGLSTQRRADREASMYLLRLLRPPPADHRWASVSYVRLLAILGMIAVLGATGAPVVAPINAATLEQEGQADAQA